MKVVSFPGKFLRTIFRRCLKEHGLELELRCIHSTQPVVRRFYKSVAGLKKRWQEIVELNNRRYDIYFSAVPREPRAEHGVPDRPVFGFLWSDSDVGKDKPNPSLEYARRKLRRIKLKPSILVGSGHGIHSYLCFDTPTKLRPKFAKELLRTIAKTTDGDLQSAEVARLLRMPNTLNWKNKKHPKRSRVLVLKTARRYRLRDFKRRLFRHNGLFQEKPSKHRQNYFSFFSRHIKQLRRTSKTQAMGLCPFHDDANPSWSLRTTDGVWHCFGCGAAGNAVSFCHLRRIDVSECPEEESVLEQRSIAIDGGGYAIWKWIGEGWRKIRISNFIIDWELENRVSDRIRLEDRIFSGKIVVQKTKALEIRLSNDEFCSNQTLYAALVREGGSRIWLNHRFLERIREASMLFSRAKIFRTRMDFGYLSNPSSPNLKRDTFLTPSLKISHGGIKKASTTQVDLESIEQARHLELKILSARRRKELLRHICHDLLHLQPRKVTYPLLGLLGGSVLMHFIDDKTRYALWLVGPSGSGKSFIAKFFQSFFGDFMREGRVVSWSSTPNSLQYVGYFFKDCIFLVDDYKPAMIRSEGPVVQFLQTYADFYARGRLTSEIKARKEYYVRGLMLTTGEDIPSGHASVVARSLILAINKREPDLERGKACRNNCKDYPGITARYVRYLLIQRNLRARLQRDLSKAHEMFLKGIEREENSVRVARNLALNWLGFRWFTRYLKAAKAPINVESAREEHLRCLLSLRKSMLNLISQEQPAEVFVRTLSEALNSGACRLSNTRSGAFSRDEYVVGFRGENDDRYIYVFPRIAIALVRTEVHRLGQHFDWTPNSLSKALERAGILITKAGRHDLAIRKRVGSKVHRVWMLRAKHFD